MSKYIKKNLKPKTNFLNATILYKLIISLAPWYHKFIRHKKYFQYTIFFMLTVFNKKWASVLSLRIQTYHSECLKRKGTEDWWIYSVENNIFTQKFLSHFSFLIDCDARSGLINKFFIKFFISCSCFENLFLFPVSVFPWNFFCNNFFRNENTNSKQKDKFMRIN